MVSIREIELDMLRNDVGKGDTIVRRNIHMYALHQEGGQRRRDGPFIPLEIHIIGNSDAERKTKCIGTW